MTSAPSITAGSIDITPQRPLPLAGRIERSGPSEGVHDPLELNALLLRAGSTTVAMLTADLLFVTEPLKEQILAGVRQHVPLDEASLLFAASHTHNAPSVDPSKPRLGAADAEYVDFVARRGVELLRRLATEEATPCRLDYRSGMADHAINRRRWGWRIAVRHLPHRAVLRAPNPAGPRDETLHLLVFSDRRDRPLALVWSYACHPVGFPAKTKVSADFPGVVRRALRAAVGAEVPVLFLQGFAGDVRPRELGPQRSLTRRLTELAVGPLFAPFSYAQYADWANSLADRVVGVLRTAERTSHPLAPTCDQVRIMLSKVMTGAPAGRSITFQRLSFSPALHIMAMSAEPVAQYGRALRALSRDGVLPVGYIDTVFGYLPTASMLGERGYEDSGFMEAFGLKGRFSSELEEVVLEAWRRLYDHD